MTTQRAATLRLAPLTRSDHKKARVNEFRFTREHRCGRLDARTNSRRSTRSPLGVLIDPVPATVVLMLFGAVVAFTLALDLVKLHVLARS